jgi:signal transduction histidine kinase
MQDIKFTIEELQTLLQSAEQAVTPTQTSTVDTADGRESHAPPRRQRVELGPLLTRCVAAAQQRLHGNSVPVLFHISSDLPIVTTNPEMAAHVFFLLFEYALTTSGREEREVHVQWSNETLIIDIDDGGRGLAQESYTRLRQLVEQLDGTLRASHELGQRTRVELTFPSAIASGSVVRQVIPLYRKGHGR